MNITAYLLVWIDYATKQVTHVGVYSEQQPTCYVNRGCWAELARFETSPSFDVNMYRAIAHLEKAYPALAELYGAAL